MADRTDLAEDRTDWAEDRTLLAAERTFAGWLRTGFAALGVALGLHALFGDLVPYWLPRAVAVAFVVTAILIFWSAWLGATRAARRMSAHSADSQPVWRITVIAVVLSLAAAATGVMLWLL